MRIADLCARGALDSLKINSLMESIRCLNIDSMARLRNDRIQFAASNSVRSATTLVTKLAFFDFDCIKMFFDVYLLFIKIL